MVYWRHRRLVDERERRRSRPSRVLRLFLQLIRGMSLDDMVALLHIEAAANPVYMYDPLSKTASRADLKVLPWPVCFLLSRYHKKHIFCFPKKPSLGQIGKALRKFENATNWRWWYRDSDARTNIYRHSSASAPWFPHAATPSITAWSRRIAEVVHTRCRESLLRTVRERSNFSNTCQ